jgi:hypothetical protein
MNAKWTNPSVDKTDPRETKITVLLFGQRSPLCSFVSFMVKDFVFAVKDLAFPMTSDVVGLGDFLTPFPLPSIV